MIKGLSLVGMIFLFISSTELLITHQRAASHNPQVNVIKTVIRHAPEPPSQISSQISTPIDVITVSYNETNLDEELLEFKQILSKHGISFLFESLVSLGAYRMNDLKYLDNKDRRRLLLETSLHAGSIGQSPTMAVESWEGILKNVGEWKPVQIPNINDNKMINVPSRSLTESKTIPIEKTEVKTKSKTITNVKSEIKTESKTNTNVKLEMKTESKTITTEKISLKVNCNHPKLPTTTHQASPPHQVSFDNIAIYINSSPDGRRYFGENFQRNYYANRVIPGIKTWGLKFPNLWIVLEDSSDSLNMVKNCPISTPGISGQMKEYNCDGKPILLSPCDNGYWYVMFFFFTKTKTLMCVCVCFFFF